MVRKFGFIFVCAALLLTACKKESDAAQLKVISEHYDSRRLEQAVDTAEAYVASYPNDHLGWNILGWSYLSSDKYVQAEKSFNQVMTLNPEWENAYVGLGSLYRKQGELELARNSYQQALSLSAKSSEAYASLLVIELMQGNDAKAVEYGEKAWALRNDLASIPANLSVAYHYLGDFEKRDVFFEHARQMNYHGMQGLIDIYEGKLKIR